MVFVKYILCFLKVIIILGHIIPRHVKKSFNITSLNISFCRTL